jgi:hypothetical protein
MITAQEHKWNMQGGKSLLDLLQTPEHEPGLPGCRSGLRI